MNPQLQAEELANEHGVCLVHEGGNLWITVGHLSQDAADELRERFVRRGVSAKVSLNTLCVEESYEVAIDLASAMAEWRMSL